MNILTIADIIAVLQKLPPEMEAWFTWDESGECFPCTADRLKDDQFSQGWLKPSTIIKRRYGQKKKLRYEQADHVYEKRAIKRSKTRKDVILF